ncbi:MAG: hypothetical protein Q4G13_05750 [Moraxella sp.]|nr:hypothetical protein [Moraxella sp.]
MRHTIVGSATLQPTIRYSTIVGLRHTLHSLLLDEWFIKLKHPSGGIG